MQLKNILTTDGDERAVSPVIGVILMVAITVILAAVI
ncbi:MAG: type IV pilin N-terminal domain-containing protein, partial [Natronomonas sp.]